MAYESFNGHKSRTDGDGTCNCLGLLAADHPATPENAQGEKLPGQEEIEFILAVPQFLHDERQTEGGAE